MSQLRQNREIWSGKDEAVSLGLANAKKHVTAERARMLEEAAMLKQRSDAMDDAQSRAGAGVARKQARAEAEQMRLRKKLWAETRQAKREALGAVLLQKLYRGHIGRKIAAKWKLRRAEIDAMRALHLAAGITIQRVYRGRIGRMIAEERRIELAEFIASIRAEEAAEEEEQYWKTHPIARTARNVRQLVDKIRYGSDRPQPGVNTLERL